MNDRIQKLIECMPQEIDAAIIKSSENRKYFTAFSSSAGTLIVTKKSACFMTDSRYIEAAQHSIQDIDVVLQTDLSVQLPVYLKATGCKSVLFEAERITVSEADVFQKMLQECHVLVDGRLDHVIDELRRIKTPQEIEKIRQAQQITEQAFEHILNFIKLGRTEKEIALELDFFMLKNGADRLSFETIAVSGENSSKPHGVPGGREVTHGDFVTMDFGAVIEGYNSDMTRTVGIGEVSQEAEEIYHIVLKAQEASISAIREGVSCKKADAAARDCIQKAGYGAFFGHGTGHGVGIEGHEQPVLSPRSSQVLRAGDVVTVEPGIYLSDRFGVRIEDMVLVTQQGYINLTQSPKNLILL